MRKKKKLKVSLGVFAYNEENNIVRTLQSISKQKLELVEIKEIIVVSSGSYDRTNELVRQYAAQDKRVRLIEQLFREGKSSAVNIFMQHSRSNILIAISGDLRLHSRAVEQISLPFFHDLVGMVGCRPIPVNIQHNPLGHQVRLLWQLHHLVSLRTPKCGEMVAFRKVVRSIPKESAVDEATLEVLLRMVGYEVVYAPRAIVYNKGPKTIKDFIKQRRRIYVGHHWVKESYNYQVSTMKTTSTLSVIKEHLLSHPEDSYHMAKLLLLEAVSRLLGWMDYHLFQRNPFVWDMVSRD